MTSMTNGSPKQIEWADKIKAGKLASLPTYMSNDLDNTDRTDAVVAKVTAQYEAAAAYLNTIDDAQWWIDRKDSPGKALMLLATSALSLARRLTKAVG